MVEAVRRLKIRGLGFRPCLSARPIKIRVRKQCQKIARKSEALHMDAPTCYVAARQKQQGNVPARA